MRYVALLALLLSACTGTGAGSIIPIEATGDVSGDMRGPQVKIAGQPVNALVKVHGHVVYTVQPFPPYLTYDGDYTIIVEPVPGREAEAIAAVTRGDLLIRRNGVPAALNAPGTIAGYKAALMKMQRPPATNVLPPPPPLPKPVAVEHDECAGGVCSIPCPR